MEKQITFRFYDLQKHHHGTPSLVGVLENICKEADKSKRETTLTANFTLRLENLDKDGTDAVIGEIVRCQDTNLPAELDKKGQRKKLEIDRLGHSVVFRYDHKLGLLGMQYDNRIVSSGRFLDYVLAHDQRAAYKIEPKLNADAWKKFKSGNTKKLCVRISNPEDMELLSGGGKTASKGIRAMGKAYGAPSIYIELSMTTHAGYLAKSANKFAAKVSQMMGGNAHLEKLNAVTYIDDAREEIDLIEDRIVARDTLPIDDRDPDKNYKIKTSYLSIEMKKVV